MYTKRMLEAYRDKTDDEVHRATVKEALQRVTFEGGEGKQICRMGEIVRVLRVDHPEQVVDDLLNDIETRIMDIATDEDLEVFAEGAVLAVSKIKAPSK